jgi:galactose mutarotase-like enzyme
MKIYPTDWHDISAYTIESEDARMVVVPSLGSKIVSLFDKTYQHEWLAAPMRKLKPVNYGADFVSQDMSGWDEMLPTISACQWGEFALPDHGEVWSRPWTVDESEKALVLSIQGVTIPYFFSRSVAFQSADAIQIKYTLINTGKSANSYLWAAHPQFVADSNTRVVLPAEVVKLVNVIDSDPKWGRAGEEYSWPNALTVNGAICPLDEIAAVTNHSCRKFYVPPDQAISWAALNQTNLGCQLRIDWSANKIPYFGLWVDEGVYNSAAVVALEPSNGYYDSLDRAVQNKRVVTLSSGEKLEWELNLRFGDLG